MYRTAVPRNVGGSQPGSTNLQMAARGWASSSRQWCTGTPPTNRLGKLGSTHPSAEYLHVGRPDARVTGAHRTTKRRRLRSLKVPCVAACSRDCTTYRCTCKRASSGRHQKAHDTPPSTAAATGAEATNRAVCVHSLGSTAGSSRTTTGRQAHLALVGIDWWRGSSVRRQHPRGVHPLHPSELNLHLLQAAQSSRSRGRIGSQRR